MTNDMASTIIAKSDQLNADDLISGAITIRIRDTKVAATGEQPVSIFYDGDNGKPWKPCKSMARVLVSAWGANSRAYIGKRLTLFRDPTVKWAGIEVGGIRISHMSDIGGDQVIPLTVTRGNKKPYQVKALAASPADREVAALKTAGTAAAEKGMDTLKDWWGSLGGTKQNAIGGASYLEELKGIAEKKTEELSKTENGATDDVPNV